MTPFIQQETVNNYMQSIARQQVMHDYLIKLGSRVRIIVTGGAATSPSLMRFLRDCFPHCIVVEAYGMVY